MTPRCGASKLFRALGVSPHGQQPQSCLPNRHFASSAPGKPVAPALGSARPAVEANCARSVRIGGVAGRYSGRRIEEARW